MKKPELSVVVPCYNEEPSILALAEKFAVHGAGTPFELILVDNGSADNTGKAIEHAAEKYGFVHKEALRMNKGYGNGIKAGLAKAGGEFICWTHADLQADPADIFRAYRMAKDAGSKYIFIKGKRTGRGMADALFTGGMSVFCSIALGKILTDINAQPSLFHSWFLTELADAPDDFSFDLFAFYKAKEKGLEVVRFPVLFLPRRHGKSSWNMGIGARMKFIKRVIDFTLSLRKKVNGHDKSDAPHQ
ncbi:MAG TPA: glycosyltransferase family 2 protein [Candidatus Diapherotrites archaeon]|uniref:Glycosyltransferase family 2 protein n=1 Tax=Candidatus Iainarchaeum sp. TaxID=3101447 RepID=A0A7J4J087_9ARCH|nr:glycosyltransferase family 2 protein [Candidatus Diapherotrites archaeon]